MSPFRVFTIRLVVAGSILGVGILLRVLFLPPLSPVSKEDLPAPPPELKSAIELPKPPRDDFVNSKACAECHQEIYDLYQSHPMARSLAAMEDAPIIENYTDRATFNAPNSARFEGQLSFYAEHTNGKFVHHEKWLSNEGDELYDQGVQVHYEIGSGQRGRSYVIDRGGLLFMSPMTWYSEQGKWDYSPGYEERDLRFERRVLDGCLACHAGRVAADRDKPDQFHERPFLEPAIGCERCHGPGKEHIAYRKSGKTDGVDPIVNPINLEPRKRDSVCNQCHLPGAERIVRYGKSEYDFRPGDDLADVWISFVRGAKVNDNHTAEAVSQVEQMMISKCYINSERKLGCVSCHDPHSRPKENQLVDFYRSRCMNCHTKDQPDCAKPRAERLKESPQDSCIQCHMPRLAAADIPHTSQTDHRILARPLEATKTTETDEIPTLHIFDEADKRVPELEIQRARGLLIIQYAEKHRNVFAVFKANELLKPVVEQLPYDVQSLEAMGLVHRQLNQREHARQMWERVLGVKPDREQTLKHLAILCQDNAEYEQGIAYLDRLIKGNPWQMEFFGRKSNMLGELAARLGGANLYPEAIRAAEQALEIDPSQYQVHEWLSVLYQSTGNRKKVAEHRKLFEAFSPKKPK